MQMKLLQRKKEKESEEEEDCDKLDKMLEDEINAPEKRRRRKEKYAGFEIPGEAKTFLKL